MKILNFIYNIFIALLVIIALLMIVSVFPVPGNYKIMVVQSGSMMPAIKMGSVVIVKPEGEYKTGDIITFGPYSKDKAPTTHRIHNIQIVNGQPAYITKGDANNMPDKRVVKEKDILGKVLFSIPFLGYAVDFAKKPLGFALIIILPAAVIIFDEVKKIYQELTKNKVIKKE
jgi:signal peptidase